MCGPKEQGSEPEAGRRAFAVSMAALQLRAVSPPSALMPGLVFPRHTRKHKTRSLVFYSTLEKTHDGFERKYLQDYQNSRIFFIELSLEYK